MDVEHTSSAEFSLWLRWNGIPWIGDNEWDFDSKCMAVNHALRHGLRPRLIAPLPDCLRDCLLHPLLELFEIVEPIPESSEEDTQEAKENSKRWIAGVLSRRGHRAHRKTVLWARYRRRRLHRRNHHGVFL